MPSLSDWPKKVPFDLLFQFFHQSFFGAKMPSKRWLLGSTNVGFSYFGTFFHYRTSNEPKILFFPNKIFSHLGSIMIGSWFPMHNLSNYKGYRGCLSTLTLSILTLWVVRHLFKSDYAIYPKAESDFCHTLLVKDWPLFPANFQSWSLAAAVVGLLHVDNNL